MKPPNAATHINEDAHDALLTRGYEWKPCSCYRGKVERAYASPADCDLCHGDGGTYIIKAVATNLPGK